jgi:PAS domain S-box-containing protein
MATQERTDPREVSRVILDLVAAGLRDGYSCEQAVRSILKRLAEYFDLPLAIASHITGEDYLVEQVIDASGAVKPGQRFALAETYCAQLLEQSEPLLIGHFGASPFAEHRCYKDMGFETYIGAQMSVDGRIYGTINLTSTQRFHRAFDASDRAVLVTAAAVAGRRLAAREHEAAMRRTEARYALALDGTRVGVWDFDRAGGVVHWSDQIYQLLGENKDEFVPSFQSFIERIHPDDREEVRRRFEAHLAAGDEYDLECRMRRADGEYVWVRERGHALRDSNGEAIRVVGSIEDITSRRDRDEALRLSEERFQLVLKALDVGIWDWNVETKEAYWSPRMREIAGVDEAFTPDMDALVDRAHPDDFPSVVQANARHLETGQPHDLISRFTNWRGEERIVRGRGQAVWNDRGEPVRMVGSVEDITERRLSELEERSRNLLFEMACEAAHIGYWQLRLSDGHVEWSDEVYAIHGVTRAEFCPNYDDAVGFYHPDDRELVRAMITQTVETQRPQEFILRLERADGAQRAVFSRAQCRFDEVGDVVGLFGIFQDVTERRRTEQRLRAQAEELKRINADLERFAFVASHDLQEPLRKVAAFGELLATRYSEKLDEKGAHYVEVMVDGARRMQTLITELLRYSRADADAMEISRCQLSELVDEAREMLAQSIEEGAAEIRVVGDAELNCDRAQICQLLLNLIGNALKYAGDAAPKVEITAERDLAADAWRICFADNGMGFSKDDAERIFNLFTRLQGRGENSGAGIGLAVCKRIIARHGGRIWAESDPGEGARFYFLLPDAPPSDLIERA